MISDEIAKRLRVLLYTRVGAFFANTSRGRGRCAVCTAPTPLDLCGGCASQRAVHGSRLADLVIPLAYVRGWMSPAHQSEHHVRRYKHPVQPSRGCLDDLRLMILGGTLLHGDCIARTVGWWQVVTFVPSASRPGEDGTRCGSRRARRRGRRGRCAGARRAGRVRGAGPSGSPYVLTTAVGPGP